MFFACPVEARLGHNGTLRLAVPARSASEHWQRIDSLGLQYLPARGLDRTPPTRCQTKPNTATSQGRERIFNECAPPWSGWKGNTLPSFAMWLHVATGADGAHGVKECVQETFQHLPPAPYHLLRQPRDPWSGRGGK